MIDLKVLGGVELSDPGGHNVTAVASQPKRLALLVYLALHPPGRFLRRDTLVATFWPELDAPHARNALSQALRFLRRQLGEHVILRRSEEEVALNRETVRSDVDTFLLACAQRRYRYAVEAYGGDLLAGLHISDAPAFERWLDDERTGLRRRFAEALEAAADEHARNGATADAAACWRRRSALEPGNSAVAMRYMLALTAAGDRGGAIAYAGEHARRLATDLDAETDPGVTALAERLRAVPGVPAAGRAGRVERSGTDPDPGPVGRSGSPRHRAGGRLVLATLALAAVATVGVGLIRRPNPGPPSSRVVVAIFEDRTGDSSLAPLGMLAADWVTQGLLGTGLLDVVPTETMLPSALRDRLRPAPESRTAALRELGRATGARYVVGGAVYLEGGVIRVQTEIIDLASLRLAAAPSAVVLQRSDPMAGIEEVRRRVMGSLASALEPRVATWATTASNPPSLPAFTEFVKGMDALLRQDLPVLAITHFQLAAEADSTYVVPLLWMIHASMKYASFASDRVDSLIRLVEHSRQHLAPADALLLDRYAALRRSDPEAAYRASHALVALAPGSHFVQMLAVDATAMNRPGEAVRALEGLDPRWPWVAEWQEYWTAFAYALHAAGDYRGELHLARQARRTHPALLRFVWLEGQALAALGRADEVERLVDSCLRVGALVPEEVVAASGAVARNVALELRAHGRREVARRMLARSLDWYLVNDARDPGNPTRRYQRMQVLEDLERWPEAWAVADTVLTVAAAVPSSGEFVQQARKVIGRAAAALGDSARARAELAVLLRPDPSGDIALRLWLGSQVAAALGDREQAMTTLREAYARGHRHTFWDHLLGGLDTLRELPEYRQLMRPRG